MNHFLISRQSLFKYRLRLAMANMSRWCYSSYQAWRLLPKLSRYCIEVPPIRLVHPGTWTFLMIMRTTFLPNMCLRLFLKIPSLLSSFFLFALRALRVWLFRDWLWRNSLPRWSHSFAYNQILLSNLSRLEFSFLIVKNHLKKHLRGLHGLTEGRTKR